MFITTLRHTSQTTLSPISLSAVQFGHTNKHHTQHTHPLQPTCAGQRQMSTSMYEVFNWGPLNDARPKRYSLAIAGSQIDIGDGPSGGSGGASMAATKLAAVRSSSSGGSGSGGHHSQQYHHHQHSSSNNRIGEHIRRRFLRLVSFCLAYPVFDSVCILFVFICVSFVN